MSLLAPATREPAAAATPRALVATGLVKRWRRGGEPVLDGVDLVLAPGESVHVTGRNGAGKTTLLRILAGLIDAEAGEVRIGELRRDAARREYQRQIALLAAGDRGLYARMTVRRHMEYWARLALLPAAWRPAAIEQAEARFALEELTDRRVDRLSMGQRQRVRLAMAFLHDPSVLLLDEPRNSLDEEGVAMLAQAVRDVLDRGGVAVWCAPAGETQGIELDRRVVLAAGRLEAT